jgi:hypothetical protein
MNCYDTDSMDVLLDCESCMRLWAEFGAAESMLRCLTWSEGTPRSAAEARVKAALARIRVHEAEAHQEHPKSAAELNKISAAHT